ncbi:hypothetical protein M407DRAFT_212672, partial [Tulasnella calospora MUT 4182]
WHPLSSLCRFSPRLSALPSPPPKATTSEPSVGSPSLPAPHGPLPPAAPTSEPPTSFTLATAAAPASSKMRIPRKSSNTPGPTPPTTPPRTLSTLRHSSRPTLPHPPPLSKSPVASLLFTSGALVPEEASSRRTTIPMAPTRLLALLSPLLLLRAMVDRATSSSSISNATLPSPTVAPTAIGTRTLTFRLRLTTRPPWTSRQLPVFPPILLSRC